MKRRAYISFVDGHTVIINTSFKTQKSFDLRELKKEQSIDLISLKVVDVGIVNSKHPFTVKTFMGNGTTEHPFTLAIYDNSTSLNWKIIGNMSRGETKEFSAYVE